MKSSIFLALVLFSYSSFAQITKNTWIVGGSGSVFRSTEDYNSPGFTQTSKFTSIDFSPTVGYFLINKLAGGLRLTGTYTKGNFSYPGGGTATTEAYKLAAGPFVRYYFLEADKPFNLLADLSYQTGLNKYLGLVHQKGKFNILSLMGGAEIFFNQAAGIEMLFGYSKETVSIEDAPSVFKSEKSGFRTSIGVMLHLQKE